MYITYQRKFKNKPIKPEQIYFMDILNRFRSMDAQVPDCLLGTRNTICVPDAEVRYSEKIKQQVDCFVTGLALGNVGPIKIPDLTDKSKYYKEFDIPKRDGSLRHIKAPQGELKAAQAWIANIFQYTFLCLTSNNAHGFVKKRGCYSAMKVHADNKSNWFLKLDIHDFFGSISKNLIIATMGQVYPLNLIPYDYKEYVADILTDDTDHVCQGCKSSPYIANLVLTEFDYIVNDYCLHHGLIYTRYADDIQISSRVKFNPGDVIKIINYALPDGINLNTKKTQFKSKNCRNYVLGVKYNQNCDLTVGHEKKHKIKNVCHALSKGITDSIDIPHWKGLLSYYAGIEPEYFKQPRFDILRQWEVEDDKVSSNQTVG